MSSKLFKVYSSMIGLDYLFHLLAGLLNELMDNQPEGNEDEGSDTFISGSLELDPNKMTDKDEQSTNKLALSLICQKIINKVLKSKEKMPR